MNVLLGLELIVPAIAIAIIHVGAIGAIRQRCGSVLTERIVLVLNVAAFLTFAATIALGSLVFLVIAVGLGIAADIFPGPLIGLTGGTDPICVLRREIRDIFSLMDERPMSESTLAELQERRDGLERFRSAATGRIIDAIAFVISAQFPTEPDHAATMRAYDSLDTALAELRRAHPW
jgi:hypothetical protein